MEGAIVQAVIRKVTDMIVRGVAKDAALINNFSNDFDWLHQKLQKISGCLSAASPKDKTVKQWLHDLQDVAWEAEDIVEECAVIHPSNVCFSIKPKRKMGKRIQEVKEKIDSVMKEGKELKLLRDLGYSEQPSTSTSGQPSSNAVRRELWKGNSLDVVPSDSHPVAIEPKLKHLMSLLDNPTVPVIAVVGMGGAGKTFLLQNLFYRINDNYEHSIWVPVSESYSVPDLQHYLVSSMRDLSDSVKQLNEYGVANLIRNDLLGKKSLIVLDDVWSAGQENNIIKRLGLPTPRESQCKIVVTTRSMEVCEMLGAFPYKMELLSEQEGSQLFYAYAFGGDSPPVYLQDIAPQVVKQCGRLPLALKITGASLSCCTEESRWMSKLHQLIKIEGVDLSNDSVMQILRLSYDSLPAALKPCFSYLSFFPEDTEIDSEYLIHLWIAEGFIPHGQNQWDTASNYLSQLTNLSLLEVCEDERLIKRWKIHDLLLDLAIVICKENRCTFSIEDDFTYFRRVLLAQKEIDDMVMARTRATCPKSLRTLSLHKNPIRKIEENFFSAMRSLRVLDLSETKISTLPKCVGKLKLLKTLNLSQTEIKQVPSCVKSLRSLVLLDLSHCSHLQMLPKWINELKCLQHLNIKYCGYGLAMPKEISELVSLSVLRSEALRLSVEDDGLLMLWDVAKLTRLQELSLEIFHGVELESIEKYEIIAKLHQMRHLSIKCALSPNSQLPQNITALQKLQTLHLERFALPGWVCMLNDLKELELEHCECSNYPALEAMPNLIKLNLWCNESCRAVPKEFGKSSGFPKLRFLSIGKFHLLEEFPDLEDGTMAVLEKFHLSFCPRLEKVPEGLERLKRLREFSYLDTGTSDFQNSLSEGGEVWNKIKAKNPDVHIIK